MNRNKALSYFLILFVFTQCTGQTKADLEGSVWEYSFESGSKDYIRFLENSKYESYSAESGRTYLGVYFIESDTLNLVTAYEVRGDRRAIGQHMKAIIEEDKLKYIEFDKISREAWKKSDFKFDPNYYLTKTK